MAVSKNTIIEYVTDRITAGQNMPDGSLNKVVIPQIPTRLEMLQNGKLAAATLPEPMALLPLPAVVILLLILRPWALILV